MDLLPDELVAMIVGLVHNPVTIARLLSTSARIRAITIAMTKSLVGPCKVSVPSTWLLLFDLDKVTNITVHLDSGLPARLTSCSVNMVSYQLGVSHLIDLLNRVTLRLIWGFNMYAIIKGKNVLIYSNEIILSYVMQLLGNECAGYWISGGRGRTKYPGIKTINLPTNMVFLNRWGRRLIKSMDLEDKFPHIKEALSSGIQPSSFVIRRMIEAYAMDKSGKVSYNQGRTVLSECSNFSKEVRGFFGPIVTKKGSSIDTADIDSRIRDYVLPIVSMSLSQLEVVDPSTFPADDSVLLTFKNCVVRWYLELTTQ